MIDELLKEIIELKDKAFWANVYAGELKQSQEERLMLLKELEKLKIQIKSESGRKNNK